MQIKNNKLLHFMKLILVLILFFEYPNLCSEENMNIHLAKDIIKLNIEYKMYINSYDEQIKMELQDYDFDRYHHYIYHIDEQIGVFERNLHNKWESKFRVYFGSDLGNSNTSFYILAIGNTGKFYQLHGFDKHSFNTLLQDNMLPVNKDNVIDVIRFFLYTVEYSYFGDTFIIEDEELIKEINTNLNLSLPKFQIMNDLNLSLPKIEIKNDKTEIELYTYNINTFRIIKYHFEFVNNNLQLLNEEVVSQGRSIRIR